MIIAILILTIFNTGLLLLNIVAASIHIDEHRKSVVAIADKIDKDIEALGTAIFNMDSIKQKVDMTGRFEL